MSTDFAFSASESVAAGAVAKRHASRLPISSSGLSRKNLSHRTINDEVEALFLPLYEADADFREQLEAVYDSEAVEGSLRADDYDAATLLRQSAPAGSRVAQSNKETLRRAISVVLRRYNISRNERRGTIEE
jgi:hypothetical protein